MAPTAALILERAAELFSRKGFAGTSIREIAEAVGVTKPTLYYHFESKEALIRHIVLQCMGAFREGFARAASSASLEETLRAMARAHLAFATTHPAMIDLMCRLHHQPPAELGDELERLRMEGIEQFGALFAAAVDRGEIAPRDPRLLTVQFLGGLFALINAFGRHRLPDRSAVELADELVDLFFVGARAPATLAQESP